MQKTLVLIKPDALQRGIVGEIIHRFERKGLKLVGLKMTQLTDELLDEWYAHHKDKDWFADLKNFMKWTPVVAMVWEGVEVISVVRKLVGITKAKEAEDGSIRGDFGMSTQQNLIHASDSEESAQKELDLIFKKEEIFDYKSISQDLIYDKSEI
jgi:nucleoside-diphosphate kinase